MEIRITDKEWLAIHNDWHTRNMKMTLYNLINLNLADLYLRLTALGIEDYISISPLEDVVDKFPIRIDLDTYEFKLIISNNN